MYKRVVSRSIISDEFMPRVEDERKIVDSYSSVRLRTWHMIGGVGAGWVRDANMAARQRALTRIRELL
jgi:hypothetical protein